MKRRDGRGAEQLLDVDVNKEDSRTKRRIDRVVSPTRRRLPRRRKSVVKLTGRVVRSHVQN